MNLEPNHESIFTLKTDELSDEIKMTSNYSLCNPIIELESRSVWLWNIDRFDSDFRHMKLFTVNLSQIQVI